MKRYFLIISLLLACSTLFAQNQVDALRYSFLDPSGTARYTSMGGAFSSIGGDFSSISSNPAGLGVYRSSELTFTPSIVYSGMNSQYLGNSESDFDYNISMGNLGYVATIINEDKENPLKSLNFAFGYNNLCNFNEMIEIEGVNNTNSLTDNLASRGYGIQPENLDNFYAYPAWYTWLIDEDPNDSNGYISTFDTYGETQAMNIQKKGHIGEYVFSMGINIEDKLYLGASFGIQDIDFSQTTFYSETDVDDNITDFDSFDYTENLETNGTGYNFKIGAIYRPIDWLRISGAVHTPTFYSLDDEYSTDFSSSIFDSTYYRLSPLGTYDYNLTSPFRAIGGISIIAFNRAIISFDYEFLDYSISKLRADDYSFNTENDAIEDSYSSASNFKVGAEYKLGQLALRGGWSYYGSPFASNQINSGSDIQQISCGFGFRTKSFFYDMAYVYQVKGEKYYMYEGYGVTSPQTNLDRTRHSILATIGFRF